MSDASDDRLIGQLIDRRYRVVRKLGGGGMGTVYEVEHSLLQDRRALKLIKLELAQQPGYRQRFFREAQWLNQSRHPHIVAVHDFQDDPEHGLFIVMELVTGANLKALLQKRGRLDYGEVLRIGREVALALQHVHRLGRVHRDVKPANILIEEGSGRAVVTDFGIAKDLGSTSEETLTQTHEVVGTLNYASPEQIGGDKDIIDERSDIYSLGTVLFEMYTGRHYGGIGVVSRLKWPEPPPEDFRLLVRAALELDTERRIASATEVIRRLEQCSEKLQARSTPGVGSAPAELAARGANAPDAPTLSGETQVTLATVVGTEITAPAPPAPPSEGTATMQQREAQTLRSQVLEAHIDELRQGIDRLKGDCLGLQGHLSDFGITAAGFTALDTLTDELASVDLEPELERRRARLEALSDELTQGRGGIESALRAAAEEAIRTAREGLEKLEDLGDELASTAELTPLRARLATAREHFTAGRWQEGLEGLDSARRRLEEIRSEANARAGEQREQSLEARRRAEEARSAVDLAEAAAHAPADVQSADALLRRGVEAERAERFTQATAAYAEAEGAFAALARRLEELRRAARDSAEATLRSGLERAESLPDELASQKRAAARQLLAGERPASLSDEVAALRQAAAGLDDLASMLPVYQQAAAIRQELAAGRARVFAQARKKAQRRPIETALADAAKAERAGDWGAARESYGQARLQLEALERELGGREPARRIVPLAVAGLVLAALLVGLVIYQPWNIRSGSEPEPAKPAEERLPPAGQQPAASGPAAVNHAPSITAANPKPDRPIVASIGDTVNLSATATDADNDPLTYSWTVDGKQAGENKPSLDVKVAGPHEVALTTTDGKEQDTRQWKIALGGLKLDAAPAKLDAVRFAAAQEFAVTPPRGQSAAGLQVAWAVDGRKVSDGPKFVFQADDPKYVRNDPIRVVATASNPQGQTFSREWKFSVRPPAPVIAKAMPPGGDVSGQAGTPVSFEVAASEPVGGQRLAYAFSVDGREQQKGPSPKFSLTPAEDQSATVTVKIEDNFQQASAPRTWKLQVSGIGGRAKAWLEQYEAAFQSRNAAKVAELRGLAAADAQKLERAFAAQKDLQVSFSTTKVEPIDATRSRVSYEMTQSFTGPDGRAQRNRSSCAHVLSLQGGRLTDTSPTPCSRLE